MPKSKESVIVFDGESSFISPRNVIYDKRKGKSSFVGQDGSVASTPDAKPQEPKPDDKPVGPTKTIRDTTDTGPSPSDGGPVNPSDGKSTGIGYSRGNFLMPDPNDPAFCDKIQMFIVTNGNGTASAEEIMSAHKAFQNYCKKVPEPTDTGGDKPKDDAPPRSGGTRPPKIDVRLPDKAPSKDTPIVSTTTVIAPLIPENLGLPIAPSGGMARGGGGGGGGDEKKGIKKTSYWWLLLVLAAAGGMYYYSKRNK